MSLSENLNPTFDDILGLGSLNSVVSHLIPSATTHSLDVAVYHPHPMYTYLSLPGSDCPSWASGITPHLWYRTTKVDSTLACSSEGTLRAIDFRTIMVHNDGSADWQEQLGSCVPHCGCRLLGFPHPHHDAGYGRSMALSV